jgi:hypothetical protein
MPFLKSLDHGDGERWIELVLMTVRTREITLRVSSVEFVDLFEYLEPVEGSGHESDPLRVFDRPFVPSVPGVERPRRLEEEDMDFLLGDGSVLHTPWHDQELPLRQLDVPVPKLHAEPPVDDQEQLVLVFVPVEGTMMAG